MKFDSSSDGIERTSVVTIHRFTRAHINAVRKHLQQQGGDASDAGVRDFIEAYIQYIPSPQVGEAGLE